ncbi:hypothetical protein PAMH19_0375 [Pseudomonas aeruginosa]|nr:hypothetical protein PAMH19_0375 [Pseudomonas aeruginosa]
MLVEELDGADRGQLQNEGDQDQREQEMIVTAQHLHTVPTWTTRQGYCHRQARDFFKRHGLDWMAFLRDGIEADVLVATGDALALKLVEHACQEVADGR